MNVTKTSRGFPIAKGVDHYGASFSIQDSSLADIDAIWLGSDGPDGGRAHLTRAHVAGLMPLLQRFVDHGSIAERAEQASPSQTPDAVREALEQRKAINTVLGRLLAPLVPDVVERIRIGNEACTAILAALDSRAGDAREGMPDRLSDEERQRASDMLDLIVPLSVSSTWEVSERRTIIRAMLAYGDIVAAMVNSARDAATPAPAVDAQSDAPLVAALCEIRSLAVPAGNVWTGDEPAWRSTIARIAHDAVERHDAAVDAVPAGEVEFKAGFEAGMDAEAFYTRGMSSDPDIPPLTADEAWEAYAAALSHGEGRKPS